MTKAILFDLDGTIADNLENIFESYNYALTELGKTTTNNKLRVTMGKSIQEMIHVFDIPDNSRTNFQNLYIDHLSSLSNHLVEGMEEVLQEITRIGIPLGIVTSKLAITAQILLEELEVTSYFDVIITSADTKLQKPSPDPLILACERLKLSPSKEIVYVGDTMNDMIAAKAANLSAFGVTWGVSRESICKEADVTCISHPKEILAEIYEYST